jgi:hypothetical protein
MNNYLILLIVFVSTWYLSGLIPLVYSVNKHPGKWSLKVIVDVLKLSVVGPIVIYIIKHDDGNQA